MGAFAVGLGGVALAGAGAGGSGDTSPDRRSSRVTCTRDATTKTFADQVSEADAGETVCLASGDYGTWTGTDKRIAIRGAEGGTATMTVDFADGDAGFTLDGIGGMGGTIRGGARDITIRNSVFAGFLQIEGLAEADLLLDRNTHNGINSCSDDCLPARVWLGYSSPRHSGVTIRNSEMVGGSSDGIQAGAAVDIIDNRFADITEGRCSGCHTDAIQLFCGCGDGVGSTVRGNHIRGGSTGIVAFDGTNDLRIERNVVSGVRDHGITLGGDRGSIVRHNTLVGDGSVGLDLTSKAGQASIDTIVENNVAPAIVLDNGVGGAAAPAVNSHNLVGLDASGENFGGTPLFKGGVAPATRAGFALAPGSPGRNAASDGTDVGI